MLSKISAYQDFHTQLYTCSPEFDFLPVDYVVQLTGTLLLPAALLVMATIILSLLQHARHSGAQVSPVQVYYLVQCLAFAVLAVLIMRLKLFLTPHLCLLVAFLARSKVGPIAVLWGVLHWHFLLQFQWIASPRVLTGLLLVGASFKGIHNLWNQHVIPSLQHVNTVE